MSNIERELNSPKREVEILKMEVDHSVSIPSNISNESQKSRRAGKGRKDSKPVLDERPQIELKGRGKRRRRKLQYSSDTKKEVGTEKDEEVVAGAEAEEQRSLHDRELVASNWVGLPAIEQVVDAQPIYLKLTEIIGRVGVRVGDSHIA